MLLAALALLSGAGLVVLVGVSLLRAGEQARAQQELEAEKGAQAMATALRAALRQPELLALAGELEAFTVAGGRLVPPARIGWLDAEPEPAADPLALGKLREAACAEFARGDAAAATAAFDDLLGERGPQGRARLPVLAAAAWQSQRANDTARCERLLQELDALLRPLQPVELAHPEVDDAVVAATLLAAARGAALPDFAARLLPALPPATALPLFARLRERSVDVAVPAREHSQLAAVRDAMRRAQDALAHGASSGANALLPRLLLWDPALVPCVLLWHPGPGAGDGRGAVIAATALADRMMRGLPDGDSPIPLLGESRVLPGADAGVPVIEGLWSVVPHDSAIDLPWTAQPAAALAAAIVLLLVLAGSGAFAFRALRQEALAVRARAEFLTVVTHELKTPLAAIRLLAEMMVEDRVPAGKTDEYYRLLAGEAARLSMLIENVLDLGRMERGERAYDLRACDLGEVAREAAVLFAPIAQRDGLQLRSDLGDGAVPGAADRGALLQALLNVLDNARKYASRGGTIELRTEREGGRLAITVRDFGPGVPAGEREAIFARFVRGDAHRHGSIPGVGLGLYLARAIARRHGGDLVCRAPADGGPGAEFAFALPLAAAPAQEVPA